VISGASDFAVPFSVESILKILHDYDCVDLGEVSCEPFSIPKRYQ
jgi:hypothetical protein